MIFFWELLKSIIGKIKSIIDSEFTYYNKQNGHVITIIMKSTLKVHNPHVIICISDVQCVIYECHR